MPISATSEQSLSRNRGEYARGFHSRAETAKQIACEESISSHRMAKTLAFYGEQGFGMAVLPADTQADLHEIQFVLGLMQIRLTTEAELQRLFPDTEVGVMPPFVNLYGFPGVVDAYLAEADVIDSTPVPIRTLSTCAPPAIGLSSGRRSISLADRLPPSESAIPNDHNNRSYRVS